MEEQTVKQLHRGEIASALEELKWNIQPDSEVYWLGKIFKTVGKHREYATNGWFRSFVVGSF